MHFHYAGFVAPLLAALAGRALSPSGPIARGAFRAVAVGMIAGPGLLAAGFTLSPALRLVAALVLGASVLGLTAITLGAIVPAVPSRVARWLLGVSAAAVVVPMLLVSAYAVGEFAGVALVTIPRMVQVHGWLNALGFALCGLLAWRLAGTASAGGGEGESGGGGVT